MSRSILQRARDVPTEVQPAPGSRSATPDGAQPGSGLRPVRRPGSGAQQLLAGMSTDRVVCALGATRPMNLGVDDS